MNQLRLSTEERQRIRLFVLFGVPAIGGGLLLLVVLGVLWLVVQVFRAACGG
jgi:hypothetical protein